MGDKNSRPYDVFDENFKDMMLIVDSPQDLIDQISSLTENQISRKLQLINIFYRKFIFPSVFFRKIFNLVLAK
jgi:excinuclease UvrABC helicase subunit UvrB